MSKQDLVVGHGASRPLSSAEFAHETAKGAVRKLDAAIRADERRRVLSELRAYIRHINNCSALLNRVYNLKGQVNGEPVPYTADNPPCTCGLSALLGEPGKGEV